MYNEVMERIKPIRLLPKDNRIASRVKTLVTQITPVKRLVVFGSRARGTASYDSDLDIFIEVPALDARLRRKISNIAWEVSLEEGVVVSTFVVTSQAITDGPLAASPILRVIDAEGIVV
jgi:predicted nucleotidyltransferase